MGEMLGLMAVKNQQIKQDLLAALSSLSPALSLEFKLMIRSLAVETFGIVWVLNGLWDERM